MRPRPALRATLPCALALAALVSTAVSPAATAGGRTHPPRTPVAGGSSGWTGFVDLNTASEAQIVSLPGVGPATARKIIAARPYGRVSDLSRAGVPVATQQKLVGLVTF